MKQEDQTLLILALLGLAVGAALGRSMAKDNPNLGTVVGGALGIAAGLSAKHVVNGVRKELAARTATNRARFQEYSRDN